MLAPWKKSYDQSRQCIKKQSITLPTKVHLAKVMVFLVVMYGCESWTIKKAERWRIDVFELWCWRIFIGRTDAKAEVPILWPPDAKSWLWKRLWCLKDWRQEEKGTTENEMVRWHHWLDGQASGVGDGQRSLPSCCAWGCKEFDKT